MAEVKILDGEFRNGLYKSLIEAGYSKSEAQSIVGTKYYEGLNSIVNVTLSDCAARVKGCKFEEAAFDYTKFDEYLKEMKKMHDILHPQEKPKEK